LIVPLATFAAGTLPLSNPIVITVIGSVPTTPPHRVMIVGVFSAVLSNTVPTLGTWDVMKPEVRGVPAPTDCASMFIR
jgi:hypothetical protein